MKFLLSICFSIFFVTSSFAQNDSLSCSSKSDVEDFEGRFKISYTINTEFGQAYCRITNSSENDVICAAKFAFSSTGLKELLAKYDTGTKELCSVVIVHCFSKCLKVLFDGQLCESSCRLPNLQLEPTQE